MAARFLVVNFYNTVAHPTHLVSANEQATGAEAWRVGAARRSPAHYWTPTTPNQQAWVKVDCGSAKSADLLVLDRVHNLGGVASVQLQRSSDDFGADITTVLTFTVPTSASGDQTSLGSGVRTPEGAYLRSFGAVSARYWRLLIPAMGAGLLPRVGGLWLGPSWSPSAVLRPIAEDDHAPLAEAIETSWGWEGRTLTVPRRSGEILLQLVDEAEYLAADEHLRDQYVRRPMWIVVDEAKAERAFLARWPLGVRAGFGLEPDYPYRAMRLPYEEYEPLLA